MLRLIKRVYFFYSPGTSEPKGGVGEGTNLCETVF